MQQLLSLFSNVTELTWQMPVMWAIGAILIYLGIVKKMEPALLVPMGFGAILVNLPLSGAVTQIDKITIIGGSDGSNGVDQVAGNVPAVMTKLFETMKETVGIDLAEVVKAGTYDAKVNRNITINADGAKQAAEVLKQETAAEASAEIAE